MFRYHIVAYSIIIMILAISPAQAKDDDIDALANLSFSDLSTVVTSVSKRPEESFTAPAAVYVITHEDIQSSGLRTIPEILRMAPGLQVSQSLANVWAITSRGFSSEFGNKLLVLIDGRTVYTPLFSGVYWEVQDTLIEDIERIEIIRGPGATLWGANAVNGVVNIITKSAQKTQTNVVNAGIGTSSNKDFIEAQTGDSTKGDVFYRVYAKHYDFDTMKSATGLFGTDSGNGDRAGFRVDGGKKDHNEYTIQGDIYDIHNPEELYATNGAMYSDRQDDFGSNILTRWSHIYDDNAKSTLQMYLDQASNHYSVLHQDNYTADIDYQYDTKISAKNDLMAGVGYRFVTDSLHGTPILFYTPTSLPRSLYSTFIQDTYKIIPDKLHFTIGSKLEHNSFTGFEVEPSARVAWYPNNDNTLWASASRAVRTPSRSEEDISLLVEPGVRWLGSNNAESEELIAYELGYRIKPSYNVLFDATTFINHYTHLVTHELVPGNSSAGMVELQLGNNAKATSSGFELASTWSVTKNWKLKGSYTFLVTDIETTNNSTDTTVVGQSGQSPKNQFNLASQLYLPHGVEFSNNLYYVDNLPNLGVPGYYRFDSRIMWTVRPGLELSLVGQNLLSSEHQEYSASLGSFPMDVGRSVYGKVTVRF